MAVVVMIIVVVVVEAVVVVVVVAEVIVVIGKQDVVQVQKLASFGSGARCYPGSCFPGKQV